MIEYNAAKRPSGLRACADGLDSNPDKDFAQKCMRYAADKMEELEQQRDRLAEALREIANEDYRGSRPWSADIAHKALAAVKGGSDDN